MVSFGCKSAGLDRFGQSRRFDCLPAHFRSNPINGHHQTGQVGPVRADIVAKVFLGCRTKIPKAAYAFYVQRREGPYRFIQNRSRTSVAVLKSDAAAEKPKDQLWRDFSGCSI